MSGVFAFKEVNGEVTSAKVLRAVGQFISHGIAIRGGRIAFGGNMVAAKNAIDSISSDEIIEMMNRVNGQDVGHFIRFAKDAVRLNDSFALIKAAELLPAINQNYLSFRDLKPLNWDLNAVGEKRATYEEPTDVAKAFVDAFGIGYRHRLTFAPNFLLTS